MSTRDSLEKSRMMTWSCEALEGENMRSRSKLAENWLPLKSSLIAELSVSKTDTQSSIN